MRTFKSELRIYRDRARPASLRASGGDSERARERTEGAREGESPREREREGKLCVTKRGMHLVERQKRREGERAHARERVSKRERAQE